MSLRAVFPTRFRAGVGFGSLFAAMGDMIFAEIPNTVL